MLKLYHFLQELSPTTDTSMVKGLMNLMDCLMDEFQDETKIAQMEEREIMSWLEVGKKNNFKLVMSFQSVEDKATG